MRFSFLSKKSQEYNYLELTPIHNKNFKIGDDGLVDILIPRFKSELAKKYLQPKNKEPYFRANLDEIGTATWKLIDGNRKVKEIGEELRNQFGERIEPVFDRLTKFLTNMHNHNFIIFKELKKGR